MGKDDKRIRYAAGLEGRGDGDELMRAVEEMPGEGGRRGGGGAVEAERRIWCGRSSKEESKQREEKKTEGRRCNEQLRWGRNNASNMDPNIIGTEHGRWATGDGNGD